MGPPFPLAQAAAPPQYAMGPQAGHPEADEVKAICTHTVCHCREGVIADVIELIERGEL